MGSVHGQLFFKKVYLAALGLSFVMQSSLHYAGSLVVARGLSGCGMWAQKLQYMWDLSSPTGNQTCIPCIAR